MRFDLRIDRAVALVAVACISHTHVPPAYADGFDDAIKLCSDNRVACVSTYDAKPGRFVEPWEYDGAQVDAVDAVSAVAARLGGVVTRDDSSARGIALSVRWGEDEAIFWFPADDALVNFRSERMDGSLWDGAANKVRIDRMRKALGYAPAPMVRNRYYRPGELAADGSIRLEEERPYKRADGRFYGDQGGGEEARGGGLSSVASPEAVRRMLFPFGQLGGRSSPAQALYDDLADLTTVRTSSDERISDQLYGTKK